MDIKIETQAHDEQFMQLAIEQAQCAAASNEVPVGAVLVYQDQVIGTGYNCPIDTQDPTAHAEIVALRAGAKASGNYRLLNTTLYVTLEPCLMCAMAMVHARIKRVVYGATDPKAGAIVSRVQSLQQDFLNHQVAHHGGLMIEPCAALLHDFFRAKRRRHLSTTS